jgi:hypothetical protein
MKKFHMCPFNFHFHVEKNKKINLCCHLANVDANVSAMGLNKVSQCGDSYKHGSVKLKLNLDLFLEH